MEVLQMMSKSDFRKVLAAFLTVFACGYAVILTLCDVPETNMGNANTILGFLFATALAAIVGFYFGGIEETDSTDKMDEKKK